MERVPGDFRCLYGGKVWGPEHSTAMIVECIPQSKQAKERQHNDGLDLKYIDEGLISSSIGASRSC